MHFVILIFRFFGRAFLFLAISFLSKKTKSRSSPAIPRSNSFALAYCGIFGYALTQNATQKNKFYQNLKYFIVLQ